MADTTRLQIPLLAASQAQKHVTHNEAVLKLDALVLLNAASYTTSAEPGSPADGDVYLLPAGKTGADWGGAANHAVAHYFEGVWHFYTPAEGWRAWARDTDTFYVHNGTQWVAYAFPNGTAGAPGITFLSDTDTGLYRVGANQLGVATGGTLRRTVSTSAETATLPQQGPDGSAATPAYGFSGDTDNGLYRIGANNPGLAAGGSLVHSWSADGNLQPLQPAFLAALSANTNNVTGNNTTYTIICDTELFDQGADYDTATGVFTAPVTGRYFLSAMIVLLNLVGTETAITGRLVTSNRTYTTLNALTERVILIAGVFDMDAGDTASMTIQINGSGGDTVDLAGGASPRTFLSGCLLA